LEQLAVRDRALILASLIGVCAISWLYLHHVSSHMHAMGEMPMAWTAAEFALMFAMWWVMMVGMMLPSATALILTFATVNRRKRERAQPFIPVFVFTAGYLLAWGAFSLAATFAQWALQSAALMLPTMQTGSAVVGGIFYLAAGIYQWSRLKQACLTKCRSPLDFVINGWRDGWTGALRMGAEQGAYCVGCCAVLMLLMFVGGLMNLLWAAALAAFVFAEKLFPAGEFIARASGVLMIAFGGYLLASA
jgi:predicted metal-binding membrane protein